MYDKPRRSPRLPFIAVAEIAQRGSGGRLSCKVAKLSHHGCYVEVTDTLPVGREISMKIFAESECFACTAKVVYELQNSGMGLSFKQVSSENEALLNQWLLKANEGPIKDEVGRPHSG